MWPMLLDMTEEESVQSLRHLELEAYSSLVSALRAQGTLNHDKRRILKETSLLLNISNERHKAEVRRAISDEKLNTIAYHITGRINSLEDWAQEGRRLVPLLPRTPPQTTYSVIADDASEAASQYNKQLPFPANTERKRPLPQPVPPALTPPETISNKPTAFRVPEVPPKDEPKRRKSHSVGESSTLAQHLLAPKLSKIQQIYRQASKAPKQLKQPPKEHISIFDHQRDSDLNKMAVNIPQTQHIPITPKINIIQNISIPYLKQPEPKLEEKPKVILSPSVNETPIPKLVNSIPPHMISECQSNSTAFNDIEQAIDPAKLCITKKTINKGQKLIVVSSAQTLPTNSILQKTLSVPMNKFGKFKIVPNSQVPPGLQLPASKPKLVTIKGSAGKKVIPLSQLQILNPRGGLKMVPYSGTILANNQLEKKKAEREENNSIQRGGGQNAKVTGEINGIVENGAISFGEIDLAARESEVAAVEINCNDSEVDSSETFSSESEVDDTNSNDDSNPDNMELDNCDFADAPQGNEVLEEFEVIHTEELLQ